MNKKYLSFLLVTFLSCSLFVSAQKQLVILNTNDTHSRIEPIPETDKSAPGLGGIERRIAYIDKVRKENKNVLLFDCGDFLQGTPYFNLFKGKVEVEAMNLMKYDAATLGNHEFDYGLQALGEVIRQANFPFVCCNYDFSETVLHGMVKPYIIIKKDGVKIGILGLGVEPKGLIAAENYEGMKFLDPVATANKWAKELKAVQKCDMVVCLSHLGYRGDVWLAAETRNIDIILGGHSHTLMQESETHKNAAGEDVLVFQTGSRGEYVGRIDVSLEKIKTNK